MKNYDGNVELKMSSPAPPAVKPGLTGFVDAFRSPNSLSGWASSNGRPGVLQIEIYLDKELIGAGTTGKPRQAPSGNCGFEITLSKFIRLDDIRQGIKAYAIDAKGDSHPLDIWQGLFAEKSLSRKETVDLVKQQSFDAGKPYIAEGEILPASSKARDLKAKLTPEDVHAYLPHLDVGSVLAHLDRDALPIPAPANREYYLPNNDVGYWLFGFADYGKVMKTIRESEIAPAKRVLDFGGSSGRVARHYFCQGQFDRVFVCDFKSASVKWGKRNFPPALSVFLNSFYPGLPFADGYFDVISAFSVFTHIEDFEDAWLLELSRLLRPGGLAYLTIHDETTWTSIPEVPHFAKQLANAPQAQGLDFSKPMAFDRKVFSYRTGAHYSCNVFHSQAYIRDVWGQIFTIEKIIPRHHNRQAVVVARARS